MLENGVDYIIRDLISEIEIILKYRLEYDNWTLVIDNLDKLLGGKI